MTAQNDSGETLTTTASMPTDDRADDIVRRAEAAARASEAELAAELADARRLQAISTQLIQEGNLDALYEQILAAAIAVMRADMGSMQKFHPGRNALQLLTWKGFAPASAAFWEWVHVDSATSCGAALRTGERMVIADVEDCHFMTGTEDLAFSRLSGIQAVQSTPLIARDGRVVGMISTHWRTPHQPAERELRRLDVLARQAADLIERKRAEDASARLAAIVTSAEDAIVSKTLEGIVTSWNASAERMFGYTAPEMIGQSILRIIPPERHNEEDHILARIRAGERVEHFETVRMAKDGHHIDVSLTISPIRDSTGTITGASKIVRDITERRRVARALQESEEKFRTLADHIPTLAWMARPDGHLFWYNQRWYEYTGTTPESQEGWGWQNVHDPEILPQVMERWTQSLSTGEPFEMVFPLKGADGVFRPFLTRIVPVKDEVGQVVRWFGVNADVTEQRRLQQRTRETLDALLHMARTLVAIPDDLRTPIQTGSSADGATLLGVAPGSGEAPIAQRLAELTCGVLGCTRVGITAVEPETERLRAVAVVGLTPEQEPRWWAEQRELEARGVRLGDGADPDELARFRAGEVFVLNMTQPPYDALPNPYGVTTTLIAPMRAGDRLVGMLSLDYGGPPHDFTDEERALASGVAQLGAVALERERLLRERAEAQATVLALAEANRRMDEFLGIASHELRTPLTSIAANVQIAERALSAIGAADTPALSQKASGRVDRAHTLLARTGRQLARLDRLIGDLLDVSRIQAGKLEFRMEPCELAEILREAVREQRAAWPQRSITLALPRHLALPLVADADRIGQVLTNYLTNALKYSPTDQPIVVRVRMPGGDIVRVEVRDSGPGLSTEQQARLWERFYRVPGIEQQSGSGVGLGLGLYICKTIIERHGGAVGVASAPGQGSTFWFTLPLNTTE